MRLGPPEPERIVTVISPYRFCVAPMMDGTDRHCRYFHRLMSARARLYTEMITAEAVLRGDRDYLLGFDPAEHPVALQLGGAGPEKLAAAAKIGAGFGYDEINLNVGCPSDRVQSGTFGAVLMKTPALVADCLAAMRDAVRVPVTVKCRIGVDDQDPEESLFTFVETVSAAGCSVFAVHARKAWLSGLSAKDNRTVPPLDYDLVWRLKRAKPDLTIILNGGIDTVEAAEARLSDFDGVMMGRAAYDRPYLLAAVDRRLFGEARNAPSRDSVVMAMSAYLKRMTEAGARPQAITRHMLGLYHGEPGARAWRRFLSEHGPHGGVDLLDQALSHMREARTAA